MFDVEVMFTAPITKSELIAVKTTKNVIFFLIDIKKTPYSGKISIISLKSINGEKICQYG